MIKLLLSLSLLPLWLHAGELHLKLQNVSEDSRTGTIQSQRVETGVSGFVVRRFSPEHTAIIASAVTTGYDANRTLLGVAFSPYTGLRQNSLPEGNWEPKAGDEVILAFAYSRGVMIAPTREVYLNLTGQVKTIDWVHPDTLATYLSYEGHPSPLKKDLSGFCSVTTTGLLFVYLYDSLFTVDCHSLGLLQISKAAAEYSNPMRPFFSRVEDIDANWFGAGSGRIDDYETYYLELLVENNPQSQKLYDFIQSSSSADKQLLDEFDLKGQP